MPEELEKLRYPIGRFEPPSEIDQDQIEKWISDIEALPADLRRRVKELTGYCQVKWHSRVLEAKSLVSRT